MAENTSEFLLSLVGTLDEATTRKNVQDALDKISKTVTMNSKDGGEKGKSSIQLFDRKELEAQGAKIIDVTKNVEKEIRKMYKPLNGKINISGLKDATGQVTQYTATITKANQVIDQYILKRMEFENGTAGYVQTNGGFTDKGYGTVLTSQIKELTKARADIENLMTQFLTGNGNKVLSDDTRVNDILNKLTEAESMVNKLASNAGYNSTEKMQGLQTLINGIKSEAEEYKNLEAAESKQAKKQESDNAKAIKNTQSQISTLKKYREDVNKILNDYVRVNGKSLITNDKYSTEIKDKAVGLLSQIYSMNQNAGLNTPEQMTYINDVIKGLKSEADEYYRINNAQKTLISNQTKEVDAIQKKVSALTGKYLDSSGNNQLFNTENIQSANEEIGKVYAKISELRANAGRSSYNFEANLSVLENMYNTLDKNVKGYYKLETEQKKSDELTQKQDKSIRQYLIDVQKIKDTTLNSNSGKALLDENNIKNVRSGLAEIEWALRNILNSHNRGEIISTADIDNLDIKFKQLNADVSKFYDEETTAMASNKSVQSQLTALNRVEQKVKDIRVAYEDSFNNANNSVVFSSSLKSVNDELDRLKTKAGNITEEEMRNLNNLTNELKRTSSMLAENEKQIQKDTEQYDKQTKTIADLESKLQGLKTKAFIGANALTDEAQMKEMISDFNELSNMINKLKSDRGSNTILNQSEIDNVDMKLKDVTQSLSLFQEIGKTTESQKNALTNVEQKVLSIQSKLLDGSKIQNPTYFNDINNQVANISTEIERLMNKAGSVTAEETRNLSNMVANLQRVGDEYAKIDAAQNKYNEDLRKQSNTIADYQRGLRDLSNLNLDPSAKGALKDQGNINNISKMLTDVNTELSRMQQISNSGQIVPVDQMDRFVQMYKNLNSEVTVARSREGLSLMNEKQMQSQINKFAEMERGLERLKAKYLDVNGSSTLMDQGHINDVTYTLGTLDSMLKQMQADAGNVTDAQINSYKDLENELNIMVQGYSKLESIQSKDKQSIEDQTHALDIYSLSVKRFKETTFNQDSASSLMGAKPEDVKRLTDEFNRFESVYNRLRQNNIDGQLLNKSDLYEIDYALKALTDDIKIVGTEMRKEMTADTSLQHMKDQADVYRQVIIGLVQELQRSGLYTGSLKQEMIGIIKELSQIKVPKDITSFNLHLSAIEKKIGNVKDALKAAFENDQLQQKLQILSSQVNGYMQQNTRAAILFKESFKELQDGIGSAKTNEDLLKLQNNFKLLQQNVQNAGKAGMTFGERMSAAVKKFMMWTGMTNVVMYLVRSIKQMVTNVKELDSAMISLKKVTDETDYTYSKIFDDASKKAQELNTSIKDIINSTAEFAKLGFTTEQAQELANVASVYSNVGGNSPICYSNVA